MQLWHGNSLLICYYDVIIIFSRSQCSKYFRDVYVVIMTGIGLCLRQKLHGCTTILTTQYISVKTHDYLVLPNIR